jgi:hypothetical protein
MASASAYGFPMQAFPGYVRVGRGVVEGVGVWVLGMNEDDIYACVYAVFLQIQLLIFCYLMHLLLVRTREIEGSGILG